MSMLKKLLVGVSVLTLLLAGCMSHEYADKIDKAVKLQEKKQQKIAKNDSGDEVKHFDKKDANIYVFDKGKYVVLEYKPLSDDAEARYYTYEFKDKKAYYNKDFNAKAYYQSHEPDYKEENMY
ncbi:hypothetical protein M459_0210430 [Staphylococcus epidermidis Scl25]|nr:conserved hypothetical protein [Staphylococcus epidermidis ATCC 12228]ARG65861.1 cystatin-like fold lipoprotein [Staphylococcus epidermidis]EST94673.1 hypothetical protein M460_0205330 [Staphylococcus epidermidis Scl31]EST98615.1 hypothetical protein M459_0210430 [Staphylococcus epidermidis Scl25]AVA10604.1 cystatin-like fold lipoprotein [Staphylococcus epidermidis]